MKESEEIVDIGEKQLRILFHSFFLKFVDQYGYGKIEEVRQHHIFINREIHSLKKAVDRDCREKKVKHSVEEMWWLIEHVTNSFLYIIETAGLAKEQFWKDKSDSENPYWKIYYDGRAEFIQTFINSLLTC